jgi:hypothetical protein
MGLSDDLCYVVWKAWGKGPVIFEGPIPPSQGTGVGVGVGLRVCAAQSAATHCSSGEPRSSSDDSSRKETALILC